MKRQELLILGIVVLALQGCATQQQAVRDPSYKATMPPTPVSSQDNNGAIFQAVNGVSLFEDQKAHRVGDILTIQLVEKTAATKAATTTTKKEQSVDLASPTIMGAGVVYNGVDPLNNSASATRDFTGDGASSQSNALTGSITVTVAQVLPNGNLVIRGEKVLTLNQGDEFIRVSGIVRPADVRSDNSVLSTQIADADIVYGGRGTLADSNQMGWLARFFNSSWWPF